MICCERPVGNSACHCAGCHQTFSGMGTFDKHQDVNYDRVPVILCRDPRSLGLVPDHTGVWRTLEGVLAQSQRAAIVRSRRAHQ